MWTPEPDEALQRELDTALARPGASHVRPSRPVALITQERTTGWLWGRMRLEDGTWLGLASLYVGNPWDKLPLSWYRAEELEVRD